MNVRQIICVTDVQKNVQISSLIKQLFTKYQFLTKLPQILHIHKNHYFFSIIVFFLDQPLLPYKFHGSDMWGMHFFYFCQFWADNDWLIKQFII